MPIIQALLRGPLHLMALSRRSGIGRESVRRRLRVLIAGGKVERFTRDGWSRTEYRVIIPSCDDVQSPEFDRFTDTLDRPELAVALIALDDYWRSSAELVDGMTAEQRAEIDALAAMRPELVAEAALCSRYADVWTETVRVLSTC